MSDEKQVFAGIEGFLAGAWTATQIEYPNLDGEQSSGDTSGLAEGIADYVSFSVTFGPRRAREVGATSVRRDGVVVFHVNTRRGNGDGILHDLSGQLLDLFCWKPVVTNVVFEDGRAFTPFDNNEWRTLTCSVDFYFNKT